MYWSKTIGLAAIAMTLAGCAVPQKPVVDRLPYNPAEYEALAKTGTGVVRGQLFARQRGGNVIKGAGSAITLNPVTSSSQQWYNEALAGGVLSDQADPRYIASIRSTRADADGRFEFKDVPPGNYFINGVVVWEAPTQFGLTKQGGMMIEKITVSNDKTTEVMLTR